MKAVSRKRAAWWFKRIINRLKKIQSPEQKTLPLPKL